MIKINLNKEKKEKIEKIFLEDLFESDKGQKKDEQKEAVGRFVKILDTDNSRNLLQKNYRKLYDYFFDDKKGIKKENVKKLLLADKEKMIELIDKFGSYDFDNKDHSDKLLNNIFKYKNFSKRKAAYNILKEMGITVCPYCNRIYIMTLKSGNVRPQFDHYFPKSKYPYLALSLYNLIPSCSICNMSKSDMDTKSSPILYPYEEEFGDEVVFTVDIEDKNQFVKYLRGDSDKIKVHIVNKNFALSNQLENQNNRLHITELYNEHKDYIKDLFKNYYINTNERVRELLNNFPELFSTEEEVRSLMLMNDIRKENWGKRPLAKLTHDIYNELEKLNFSFTF